ncbi:hypothetical protein P4O66_012693, partial [Electrophorus voltai]
MGGAVLVRLELCVLGTAEHFIFRFVLWKNMPKELRSGIDGRTVNLSRENSLLLAPPPAECAGDAPVNAEGKTSKQAVASTHNSTRAAGIVAHVCPLQIPGKAFSSRTQTTSWPGGNGAGVGGGVGAGRYSSSVFLVGIPCRYSLSSEDSLCCRWQRVQLQSVTAHAAEPLEPEWLTLEQTNPRRIGYPSSRSDSDAAGVERRDVRARVAVCVVQPRAVTLMCGSSPVMIGGQSMVPCEERMVNPLNNESEGVPNCRTAAGSVSNGLRGRDSAPPKFLRTPNDQTGVQGGVASFICQASGEPRPKIVWNKKGKRVSNQRFEVIEFDDGSGSVLRIQPLRTPRDEAIYECVASNNVGEISATTRLTVLRASFIKNSKGLWETTLEANFRPTARAPIKCGIYQGDSLSPLLFCIGLNPLREIIAELLRILATERAVGPLLCMDDVKPCARTTKIQKVWQKDGPKQKPEEDGDEEEQGASWEDKSLRGTYHRQRVEVADMEKPYQWLEKAELKDSMEALIMAAQEQEDQLPPGFPTIDMGPQLKVVERTRTATMLCAASGNPDPDISWFKDFLPVNTSNNNGRIKQLRSGALQIEQSEESDQGKYECVATNNDGTRYSAPANLYVRVRRVPPRFSIPPTDSEIMPGGSVNITCVAVGSPMPYVKWMLGAEDLTPEDDMPIGRNVLELTDVRQSANYTCVAMSTLGVIEAVAQITVKALPKAPGVVMVTERTATSITLTWDSGNPEPVSYYIIQHKPKYSEDSYKEIDGVATTRYSVGGLSPYSDYEFRVVAVNNIGRGPASDAIEAKTAEQAPSTAPRQVRGRMLSATTAIIHWEEPEEANGQIMGYRVYYTLDPTQHVNQWEKQIVRSANFLTIQGLTPNKTYYIKVLAYTSVGDGPLSSDLQIIAKTGVPSQPTDFRAEAKSETSVLLSWVSPPQSGQDSQITGYELLYKRKDEKEENRVSFEPTTTYLLKELRPFTVYTFQLAARSRHGIGAYTNEISAETPQTQPSAPPQEITCSSPSSTNILVSWKPPPVELQNGIITKYTIQYAATEGEDTSIQQISEIPPENSHYLLENLEKWTEYRVTVIAHTDVGAGPESLPQLIRTEEDVPSGPPRKVEVEAVNSSSVKVVWRSPVPNRQHGQIRGYQVHYVRMLSGEPVGHPVIKDILIDDAQVGPQSGVGSMMTRLNMRGSRFALAQLQVRTAFSVLYLPPSGVTRTLSSHPQEMVLTDLQAEATYSVTVAAYTTKGDGARSKPKLVTTTGAVPEKPRLMVSPTNMGTALLQWHPPPNTHGLLQGYRLRFGRKDVEPLTVIEFPERENHYTTKEIHKGASYTFRLSARNRVGFGEETVKEISTPEDTPSGFPQGIVAESATTNTIQVSWLPVLLAEQNGAIIKYALQYKDINSPRSPSELFITAPESTVVLDGLKADTTYDIKMCAFTSKGPGPYSPSIQFRTQPLEQAVFAKNFHVKAAMKTSVLLMWEIPENYNPAQPFTILYDNGQSVEVDGKLTQKLITNLQPETQYSFLLTNRGNSAGGLQHRVSAMTAPDVLRTKPYLMGKTNSDGMVTVELPPVQTTEKVKGYYIVVVPLKKQRTGKFVKPWDSPDEMNLEELLKEINRTGGGLRFRRQAEPQPYIAAFFKELPSEFTLGDSKMYGDFQNKHLLQGQEYIFFILAVLEISDSELRQPGRQTMYATSPYSDPVVSADIDPQPIIDEEEGLIWVVGPVLAVVFIICIVIAILLYKSSRGNACPPQWAEVLNTVWRLVVIMSSNAAFLSFPLCFPGAANQTVYVRVCVKRAEAEARKGSLPNSKEIPSHHPTDPVELRRLNFQTPGEGRENVATIHPPTTPHAASSIGSSGLRAVTSHHPFRRHTPPFESPCPRGGPAVTLTPPLLCVSSAGMATHPPIPIMDLADHLERLKANDNLKFSQEYESVDPGQQFTWEHSNLEVNKAKNRYANVIAYDHSRVLLSAIDGERKPMELNSLHSSLRRPVFERGRGRMETHSERSRETLGRTKEKKGRWCVSVVRLWSVGLAALMSSHPAAPTSIPGSDYINANYIDGYRKQNAYIATQGALPETFGDFWRMVWEQRSANIVMMTKLEERSRVKCDQYWPTRGTETYGLIQVTLLDTVELATYCVRTFALYKNGSSEKKEVRQFQFTAWPDHGVPEHPTPFLAFLRRVKACNPPDAGPMVVHCSAGVGRTGCFIVIDAMLERIKHEKTVDIYGHVTLMRAPAQLHGADRGPVRLHPRRPAGGRHLRQHGGARPQPLRLHPEAHAAGGRRERYGDGTGVQGTAPPPPTSFAASRASVSSCRVVPNSKCSQPDPPRFPSAGVWPTKKAHTSRFISANLPCNKFKNRLVNIMPYESTRVCLQPIRGVEGSDYINASFIDGYRCVPRNRRRTSPHRDPPAETTEDFWRMLWEHNSTIVVMLTKLREMGREKCHQYWPAERSARYQYFVVDPMAEYNMPQYILREFKVTDARDGQSRTVRQFQFTDWPEQGVPKSGEGFIDFIGQVHKTKEQFGQDGPISVHCSAGVGRTGVFITLSIVLERMRYEGVVDIFQTVKMLRTQRPAMVQTE